MSGHAPTPWSISDCATVCDADGNTVAVTRASYFLTSDQMVANERLIAAAPEMYEALKRADVHFRMLPPEMDEPGSVMAQMRAAIAKAEGRQP